MKPDATRLPALRAALEEAAGREYLEAALQTALGPAPEQASLTVYVYSEDDGRLRPVATWGNDTRQLATTGGHAEAHLAALAYAERRIVAAGAEDTSSAASDGLISRDQEQPHARQRASQLYHEATAAPLMLGEECVGAVLLAAGNGRTLAAEVTCWAPLLGAHIGQALQNILLRRELVLAREQLERAREQLFQSDKMASIGQLAAGVAHEINNPIGFIHSNLNTLSEYVADLMSVMAKEEETETRLKQHWNGQADEVFQELDALKEKLALNDMLDDLESLVTECQEGTERVNKIVRDLKSFSRPDSEDPEVARVDDILESALNIVWNQLKYKATVTKDYSDLPAITCYPNQLGQVFVNLLVNAGQAIRDKGEIALHTYQHEGRVCVNVRDKGCGIPPENVRRIFEPFFTSKPVGQGTGLGLSISHSIVQKHGGEIRVESEVGVGTSFTVYLPFTCPGT